MAKTKSCPFCGGNARASNNYEGQWGVFCETCSAVVWETTINDAIAAWNRRTDNSVSSIDACDVVHGRLTHQDDTFRKGGTS